MEVWVIYTGHDSCQDDDQYLGWVGSEQEAKSICEAYVKNKYGHKYQYYKLPFFKDMK